MADRLLTPKTYTFAILGLACASIVLAWFFELVVGLAPCDLCLKERWFYYIAIPVALLAVYLSTRVSKKPYRLAMAALAIVFLFSATLAAYHAGVEYGFWAGPKGCTGNAAPTDLAALNQALSGGFNVPRCDQVPWSFAGVSLAGYNTLLSLFLAVLSVLGLRSSTRSSK